MRAEQMTCLTCLYLANDDKWCALHGKDTDGQGCERYKRRV